MAALVAAFGAGAQPGFEREVSAKSAFWSTYAEGTLMMGLQPTVVTARVSATLKDSLADEAEKRGVDKLRKALFGVALHNVNNALEYVEQWLEAHDNFTGTSDYGVGDVRPGSCGTHPKLTSQVMMHFALAAAYAGGKTPYKFGPKTVAWLKRVSDRPAFQRAVARRLQEEKAAKAARSEAKL